MKKSSGRGLVNWLSNKSVDLTSIWRNRCLLEANETNCLAFGGIERVWWQPPTSTTKQQSTTTTAKAKCCASIREFCKQSIAHGSNYITPDRWDSWSENCTWFSITWSILEVRAHTRTWLTQMPRHLRRIRLDYFDLTLFSQPSLLGMNESIHLPDCRLLNVFKKA